MLLPQIASLLISYVANHHTVLLPDVTICPRRSLGKELCMLAFRGTEFRVRWDEAVTFTTVILSLSCDLPSAFQGTHADKQVYSHCTCIYSVKHNKCQLATFAHKTCSLVPGSQAEWSNLGMSHCLVHNTSISCIDNRVGNYYLWFETLVQCQLCVY